MSSAKKSDKKTSAEKRVTTAPSGKVEKQDSKVGDFSNNVEPEKWDFTKKRIPDDPADAGKKPLDIEALYKLKGVSSPRWSPDGKTILFNVITYTLDKGKSEVDIYRIGSDGKGLRQMTRFEGPDMAPVWSPDGESFIFVSTRNDGSQLWRMPIDGGEPEQLTKISTGVSDPTWSPDGKKIAFTTQVYPEHGADDAANKALADDIEASPIKAYLSDHLLYRHWTGWDVGTRGHIFVFDIETEKMTDVTPGDFESPVFSLGGGGFAFSPDSSEICFASNREDPDAQAWTTNADLWVVPIEGGEAKCLTADNKSFDGSPSYSPDGRYIGFMRQEIPGFESDRFRISLYDRNSGDIKVLTESFDNQINHFEWLADSRSILFQGHVSGRFPLFRLDVETGNSTKLDSIPSVRQFDIADDGRLAFTFNSVGDPVELFIANASGDDVMRITALNRDIVKEHDIRPVEEMWIDGSHGKKVHTFVVKPHGFTKAKKYPLVINVHGGPQYQWSDSFRGDWQVYPAAGYVVAFPNPTGSTGYGQEYTEAISKDWGGKVYDEIMAVTDALAALDYVDADRMGIMGWSFGGYMMNWVLGHTDRFKAVASMMGCFDLISFYGATEELWFPEWDFGGTPWDNPEGYAKWNPATHAKNFKTPTLVITGEKDFRIPYTQSLMLFTALRRQNVPARLIVFPNDGHWPNRVKSMPLYYAAHLDWFHKYLGGDPAPYDIKKMIRGRAFKK
ncbi:MAG: S9 family peptidase [Deltaproteobacteria bacterium]|nr:S9 family peptidase [Deltaproteobacteria bacterium]